MEVLVEINLFITVAMISFSDAVVRIAQDRADAGENYAECGEKLVLTCSIDNYTSSSTMNWKDTNNSLTLVSCTGTSCNLNPAVNSEYNKSEDTSSGIFNLTIPTVTRRNSEISYLCENSLGDSDSSIVKVRDYRPEVNETSNTKLTVRTGCIDDQVTVVFRWKKRKAGTDKDENYEPTYVNAIVTIDNVSCSQDTECGLSDFITKEKTIEAEPGDENDYFLIAVISYDGFEMESSKTQKTYKIAGGKCVFDSYDVSFIVCYAILLFSLFFYGAILMKWFCTSTYNSFPFWIAIVHCVFSSGSFLYMSCNLHTFCKGNSQMCKICELDWWFKYSWLGVSVFSLLMSLLLLVIATSKQSFTDHSTNKQINKGRTDLLKIFYFVPILNLIMIAVFLIIKTSEKNNTCGPLAKGDSSQPDRKQDVQDSQIPSQDSSTNQTENSEDSKQDVQDSQIPSQDSSTNQTENSEDSTEKRQPNSRIDKLPPIQKQSRAKQGGTVERL